MAKVWKKTIEEWHRELQTDFMVIVNKMIQSKCNLPNEFELFYKVEHTNDRYGHHIKIRPYLDKEKIKCYTETEGSGKYWSDTIVTMVDSKNSNCKHQVCFDIDGW